MSFIFDLALIAIVVLTILRSARRGFVKSVMNLVALVAAIVLANAYSPALARWYYDKCIITSVSEKIQAFVSGFIPSGRETADLSAVFADSTFLDIVERYGGDVESLQASYGSLTEASAAKIEELSVTIAQPVAETISRVLAYGTIFFGALVLLCVAGLVVDLIFKLPVLRTANKLLGIVFGVVCALLYAWLFAVAAAFAIEALGAIEPGFFGPSVYQNSVLLKFFNEINPLRGFFLK